MDIKCKSCIHENTCKYANDYKTIINRITINVTDPFTLTLECPFYNDTTGANLITDTIGKYARVTLNTDTDK